VWLHFIAALIDERDALERELRSWMHHPDLPWRSREQADSADADSHSSKE
jgi:hypothetical protein